MLDFWPAAAVLILLALGALWLPLRGIGQSKKNQADERRAANLALYHERLAELAAQSLPPAELQAAQAEAARELLQDSRQENAATGSGGRALVLLALLLIPLLCIGLYLHFGAGAQLALTRELQTPPASVDEMFSRLERITQVQPEAVEGWYFLGRAYMAAEQPDKAANAFAEAARLSGRAPEMLGKWAESLYFAGGMRWTGQLQALTDEALQADPKELSSLGLLGIAAFEQGHWQQAIDYWQRLAALLPQGDPSRAAIEGGMARAQSKLAAEPSTTAATPAFSLAVRVELAPELKDKVAAGDSLFVFIRAAGQGAPNMPLAVKRLKVADLPLELTFTDSDAMLPELKPSAFAELQISARVSRSGNPLQGEWLAQGAAFAANSGEMQQLRIGQADERH